MLIDLHAHAPHPGYYNQHPHWGPFFEEDDRGHIRMRVGHWVLTLGQPERKAAEAAGTAPRLDEWMSAWADPSTRIKAMNAAGQDAQVVSLPSHAYMYWTDPEFSVRFARKVNDTLAEYCSAYPDRLFFWAHAPLNAPVEAAREIRRAVTTLGAKGLVAGGANFGGLEFYDEAMHPVFETLCELDVPMFVHGYNQSVTWGEKANEDRFETTAIVGMNYDEARCFWYLVCGGVLDRFPDLKVYLTHAGGFVPYQIGRLAMTNPNLEDALNKRPVEEYLKNFWFDPELHELSMRQSLVDIVGANHLVYGTNFGGSDAIRSDMTEGLRLSQEDLDRIRYRNACDLLHLAPASIGRCPGQNETTAGIRS
ncbi:amidohydrolase family protein [Paraburkholderia xenovorans LB400]|uniref:Hydrolase n=1 Tax=Paraburkholderia xenovorans (strain LB400) TaxID=266265 RepID=Q13H91_PARXL|nr:amidohydrolase family protein [Paraburkholderia xenovorans]ABE36548.1 Putative hydrolase [Paraburkholderia xenovorans LB400]AIP34628.1 amidohydrolase family protein [Paraburkholderia xenovorans LB400]